MPVGNALVGQSGGPTCVINASLVGVVDAASKNKRIGRVFGMRFGIEGVLDRFLIDLQGDNGRRMKALRTTPSSALGASRLKLRDEHFPPLLECLKKFDIRYFFMIGGNDTMDTIHRVTEYAAHENYSLVGVGICKTVDNDLGFTDHTPGFPSAARYVALSVMQGGLLARDMRRVDQFTIFQTVGRSAGWLPAAATSWKRSPADPPHIVLVPERPFERARFLSAVAKAHERHGFVSIVCGEGITDAAGNPVSAAQAKDNFNNVEFGAMGGTSAAMMLHRMIADEFGWRGEFQIAESLQMCAMDRAVKLDLREAYGCGKEAVRLAVRGEGGVMVTIERVSKRGESYASAFGTAPLKDVANAARPMPDKYIGDDGLSVAKSFQAYIDPLVGQAPNYASLVLERARP